MTIPETIKWHNFAKEQPKSQVPCLIVYGSENIVCEARYDIQTGGWWLSDWWLDGVYKVHSWCYLPKGKTFKDEKKKTIHTYENHT